MVSAGALAGAGVLVGRSGRRKQKLFEEAKHLIPLAKVNGVGSYMTFADRFPQAFQQIANKDYDRVMTVGGVTLALARLAQVSEKPQFNHIWDQLKSDLTRIDSQAPEQVLRLLQFMERHEVFRDPAIGRRHPDRAIHLFSGPLWLLLGNERPAEKQEQDLASAMAVSLFMAFGHYF